MPFTFSTLAVSILVMLTPDKPGTAPATLPADTGAIIDLSQAALPVDAWYAIEINKQKAGYEHMSLTRDGDRIRLATELAFSTTDKDNDVHLQHYVAAIELTPLTNPKLIRSESRFPPDFINVGNLDAHTADGKPAWGSKATWQEAEGDKSVTKTGQTSIPAPADLLPDFGLEQLAAFLPTTPDACRHVTILNTGAGDLTEPSAMKVAGVEDIEIGGAKIRTTRIDSHTARGITRSIWVDDHHRVVLSDWLLYSTYQLRATLTDRQTALSGVTAKELQPLQRTQPR